MRDPRATTHADTPRTLSAFYDESLSSARARGVAAASGVRATALIV